MIALNAEYLEVNEHGHLVCPYCECILITPPCCRIMVGLGTCPNRDCNEVFLISEEVAERYNKREEGS